LKRDNLAFVGARISEKFENTYEKLESRQGRRWKK
jgi:hypothetical protein